MSVAGATDLSDVRNRVTCDDALRYARRLPADSVDLCVTSPPYFGLRVYGTEPQIWGGDPACAHVWGGEERGRRKDLLPREESASASRTGVGDRQGHGPPSGGRFCRRCGAWRGELGGEPTPELYVGHLTLVLREARRALKPTGVLLLNLGDTYWNDPGGQQGAEGTVGRKTKEANRAAGRRRRATRTPHAYLKRKDLCLLPYRVADALQRDGWWVRGEYVWHKPNGLPESVGDRCTRAHELVWHLTKRPAYFWDPQAVREPHAPESLARARRPWAGEAVRGHPSGHRQFASAGRDDGAPMDTCHPGGRNKRSVWTIPTEPTHEAHFATMPTALVRLCIRAATSEYGCCPGCGAPWTRTVERAFVPQADVRDPGRLPKAGAKGMDASSGWGEAPRGTVRTRTTGWRPSCRCGLQETVPAVVYDPFAGSGTVPLVALQEGRNFLASELSPAYVAIAEQRIAREAGWARKAALPLEGAAG
jgi:DNA modification methylase